jgi:outer membrane protein OmpA-like peptidoglycan-associated protein
MHRLGLLLLLACVVSGSVRAADPPEKFVVFFQEWSAAIDDAAQDVITHAADWAKAHPGNFARVNGFASPTGSRQANILMADLRAQRVVDQLLADGVDAKRIHQRGHGPVPFAISEQESRRVEISIGRR